MTLAVAAGGMAIPALLRMELPYPYDPPMQYVVQSARIAVVIVAGAFLLLALHSGVRAGATASVFSVDGVRWSLAVLTAVSGLFVALVALHARFWERQPVPGVVPGVAAVCSLIGLGVLLLPTPQFLPAVFSGLLVVVAVIYGNVPFLIIVWSAMGAIAGISTLTGASQLLGVLLVVASLISGAKVIIDLIVAECTARNGWPTMRAARQPSSWRPTYGSRTACGVAKPPTSTPNAGASRVRSTIPWATR